MKRTLSFKKIINGQERKWKIEVEVAEFPSILKKGTCHDCGTDWEINDEKKLILSEDLLDTPLKDNGHKKIYRCLICAYPFDLRWGEAGIELGDIEKLNEIKRELNIYYEKNRRKIKCEEIN